MLNSILGNEVLNKLLRDNIEENGSEVLLNNDFYNEGSIDTTRVVNISVDTYYNSQRQAITPPSIDNLVVIKRGPNEYSLYLIELKNISALKRLDIDNIKAKFDTTVNNFMLERFNNEFSKEDSRVIDFNLWLVCNRFNFMGHELTDEDYKKRVENTAMERLLLMRPFRYKNKLSLVNMQPSGVEIV